MATTAKLELALAKQRKGCLGKSAEDEPVFVLVARDVIAPRVVRRWAREAARVGSSPEKIGNAMLDAEQMERWQRKNFAKVPD